MDFASAHCEALHKLATGSSLGDEPRIVKAVISAFQGYLQARGMVMNDNMLLDGDGLDPETDAAASKAIVAYLVELHRINMRCGMLGGLRLFDDAREAWTAGLTDVRCLNEGICISSVSCLASCVKVNVDVWSQAYVALDDDELQALKDRLAVRTQEVLSAPFAACSGADLSELCAVCAG